MLRKLPFAFCFLSIFACNSEDFDEISTSKENKGIVNSEHLVSIEDGRLSFSSAENFNDFYQSLKDESPDKVADLFKKDFYSHDFLSFAPAIKDENDPIVEKHLNNLNTKITFSQSSRSKNLLSEDDIDDLEDILGDENLTYILNSDGEVKIGNKIYKFTDAGLFISDEQHLNKVNRLLDENNIPTTISLQPNEENTLTFLDKYNPEGGNVEIEEGVTHYVSNSSSKVRIRREGGGVSFTRGSGNHPTNTEEDYFKIAETLPETMGNDPLLGNLFGTVIVAHDQYQRKKRVKIKYYDIDVSLVYAMGIKVKHQKRGWTRLWSKTNADEIALGISSITWKFDRYQPFKKYQSYQEAYLKKQNLVYSSYNDYLSSPPEMPNFPNFIEKGVDFFYKRYDPSDFISEKEAQKKAYQGIQYAFKLIMNQYKGSNSSPYAPEAFTLPSKILACSVTPSSTRFMYFQVTAKKHEDKIEKIFDFGVVTPRITYDFEIGNINFGSYTYDFRNPDLVSINAFGMAKAGGEWHGRRLSFSK